MLFWKEGQSNSLFCSLPKSKQERFALLLFTKRANNRKSLFHSLTKEGTRAIHSFALYQKSTQEQFALLLFTKGAKEQKKEQITLFCSFIFTKMSDLLYEKSKFWTLNKWYLMRLFELLLKKSKRAIFLCRSFEKSDKSDSLFTNRAHKSKSLFFSPKIGKERKKR